MEAETIAEASGGTLFAQVALLILGYAWPAAPQWARAIVAIVIGVLSALAGELRGGMAALDVLAALTIGGQGLITAGLALGLFAGIGTVQDKRARAGRVAAGAAGRHGTAL